MKLEDKYMWSSRCLSPLQVYLARTEGSSMGRISWKLDFAPAGLKIKSVSIMASSQTFQSGTVCWHSQADQVMAEFTGGIIMKCITRLNISTVTCLSICSFTFCHSVWTHRWEDAVYSQSVWLLGTDCSSDTWRWRRGIIVAALAALQTKLETERRVFIWNAHPLGGRLAVALKADLRLIPDLNTLSTSEFLTWTLLANQCNNNVFSSMFCHIINYAWPNDQLVNNESCKYTCDLMSVGF